MTDNLAEWISEKPSLIEELQNKPLLEAMLRRITPPKSKQKVSDEQWNQIVTSLKE